jgi:hypothetical protein
MLFSANECGTVSADISLQNQDDLSVNYETHYKHALGFRVRIITAGSWQELIFLSSFVYYILNLN